MTRWYERYLAIVEFKEEELEALKELKPLLDKHKAGLVSAFRSAASGIPEAGELFEEGRVNLEELLPRALGEVLMVSSREYAERLYRVGLVHAAHGVSSNYVICMAARLAVEVARVIVAELPPEKRGAALSGFFKALGVALALVIAGYEDAVIELLGGRPELLTSILKTQAKNLLSKR